jgi:hypothetical protein
MTEFKRKIFGTAYTPCRTAVGIEQPDTEELEEGFLHIFLGENSVLPILFDRPSEPQACKAKNC